MNMLRRISFPLLLATMILSAVVLTSMALRADDGSLLQIGDTMPAFSVLPLGATDSLRSAELRGKPCAIVFFDSSCYDCRKALPRVERMQREIPDVRFLCIARDQTAADVAQFWKQENLTLPVAAPGNREIYNLFARRTIPRLYLFNAEGILQKNLTEKLSVKSMRRALKACCNDKL